MSEETKEATNSDDALNQAAEAHEQSEEKPELEQTASETKEEVKEEPSQEHKERSALGRRVSNIEGMFNQMMEKLEGINQTPQNVSEELSEDQYVTTYADLDKWASQREQQKSKNLTKYNENYLNSLAKLGMQEGLDEKEFVRLEEIIKTKTSRSNFTNPALDAELNFQNAMRTIEKERLQGPSLKGDTPVGTGVGGTVNADGKQIKTPKLDEHAKAFVNYHKMKDEDVAKTLNGETPLRLRK